MNEHRAVIETKDLHFSYQSEPVLRGLNLSIKPGTIIGLLGKNGSGKTTLFNCLLGFLAPQDGHSSILGDNSLALSANVRQRLAFVPQTPDLFDWMTTSQIIAFVSKFYSNWNHELVETLLSEWEVPRKGIIRGFSVGETQKLAIVMAMGHQPDLLLMDEPVASLDPSAKRKFIRQLVELNSESGNTVLFSTHITADIERAAADVAIIKSGRTYFQGAIDDLKEHVVKLHIKSRKELDGLGELLQQPGLIACGNETVLTLENFTQELKSQIETTFDADVEPQTMGLEDIFVELAD